MDHTTHSSNALGSIHSRLALVPDPGASGGFLLHTCHRVEWYSDEKKPPVRELVEQSTFTGEGRALARLSQIAAGARSIISGDRLVLQQVIQARDRVSTDHRLSAFVSDAVEVGRQARQRFDLAPAVDYSDIPRALRQMEPALARRAARRLVIVGGGMLARAVASASGPGYPLVVMVTRNPSRLRGSIAVPADPTMSITVTGAQEALDSYTDSPFDLVIATTSTNSHYRRCILQLARHRHACLLLDYSAVPMLPDGGPGYRHVSDRTVLDWVARANAAVEQRARQARAWITQVTRARRVPVRSASGG